MTSTLLQKINFRRIAEPVFLGLISNTVINFMMNPRSFQLRLDEFITACILSIPITELSRYIDKRLDRKINWIKYPGKRFITHLVLISLCLVVTLDVLGNIYLWITNQGFFSWNQVWLINIVTLCLSIFLTFVNWAVHFYYRWMGAETAASESALLVKDLRQKTIQTKQAIEIQKGTSKIKAEVKNIRIAKIVLGIVRVYLDSGEYGFFQGTISQLNTQLPEYLFFQATRDTILHGEVIKGVSSASYGKIQLFVNEPNGQSSTYIVSRPKAAAFRKWYNSISMQKE